MKTTRFSFIDLMNQFGTYMPFPTDMNQFVYDTRYRMSYGDAWWKFHLVDLFVDKSTLKWYGKKNWY
jgi:hypothetical protein